MILTGNCNWNLREESDSNLLESYFLLSVEADIHITSWCNTYRLRVFESLT